MRVQQGLLLPPLDDVEDRLLIEYTAARGAHEVTASTFDPAVNKHYGKNVS